MREIFDFVPAGAYRTSPEGRVLAANEHLTRILGFPSVSALLGRDVKDFYADPGDRERLLQALAREGSTRMEVQLKRLDGILFHAEIFATLVDSNGSRFVTGILNDISDRKRLEGRVTQFRRAVDASDDAIFVTDRDGTFTYINPAFTRLYGHAAEEVLGRCTPRILKCGKYDQATYAAFWKTLLEGASVRNEFINRRKDGTLVLVDVSVNPITGEDGAISGFLAIQRDITARRQVENALRESEALFRRVFDDLPVGTALVAADGRFHRANKAFCSMMGRSEAELKELTAADITHPDDRPSSLAAIRDLREGRIDHIAMEKRYVRKDGATVWGSISVRLIHDADGRPLWTMPVVVDVTERQRLEQQLRQSQKMEAVGQLAGGIAHDFNNILTAMMGYGELLVDQAQPGTQAATDLEHILEGGKRAAALTRQLLAFSRKQVLRLEVVDLNEVLGRFQQFARPLIGEDIRMEVDLAGVPVRTRADASQLEQVLLNLLVNARDAMPGGGRIIMRTDAVTIGRDYASHHVAMEPGEYVELVVSDTGAGMSEHVKQHLFEPFFTTKETGKGTGLGLATIYGIVKQMGGFIWVYSEETRGTTFKIYFPRCEEGQPQPAERAGRGLTLGGKERILLVEDDGAVRKFASAVLSRNGYQVSEAENGEAALEHLRALPDWPDLIVTDIVMPGMNGPELARTLVSERPDTRVLFTSGYASGRFADRGAFEGTHVLEKPFAATDLLLRVREALDR